jgi:hypothetical protein
MSFYVFKQILNSSPWSVSTAKCKNVVITITKMKNSFKKSKFCALRIIPHIPRDLSCKKKKNILNPNPPDSGPGDQITPLPSGSAATPKRGLNPNFNPLCICNYILIAPSGPSLDHFIYKSIFTSTHL